MREGDITLHHLDTSTPTTVGRIAAVAVCVTIVIMLYFVIGPGGSAGMPDMPSVQPAEESPSMTMNTLRRPMTPNPQVFFEITVDGMALGRIEMELFADTVPKTAENFRALATGERGMGRSGKPLHYKGSHFHRIIPGFMLQGGDFTRGDGTGGESIYPPGKFKDENFRMKHDHKYTLSMANSGKDTNGSQFFITVNKTPWLNGKHVVFGRVTSGQDVVDKIEALGSQSGKPSAEVVISDCGQM